jgi:hypothetical protein
MHGGRILPLSGVITRQSADKASPTKHIFHGAAIMLIVDDNEPPLFSQKSFKLNRALDCQPRGRLPFPQRRSAGKARTRGQATQIG